MTSSSFRISTSCSLAGRLSPRHAKHFSVFRSPGKLWKDATVKREVFPVRFKASMPSAYDQLPARTSALCIQTPKYHRDIIFRSTFGLPDPLLCQVTLQPPGKSREADNLILYDCSGRAVEKLSNQLTTLGAAYKVAKGHLDGTAD